jgi:hypothetical protein
MSPPLISVLVSFGIQGAGAASGLQISRGIPERKEYERCDA